MKENSNTPGRPPQPRDHELPIFKKHLCRALPLPDRPTLGIYTTPKVLKLFFHNNYHKKNLLGTCFMRPIHTSVWHYTVWAELLLLSPHFEAVLITACFNYQVLKAIPACIDPTSCRSLNKYCVC